VSEAVRTALVTWLAASPGALAAPLAASPCDDATALTTEVRRVTARLVA
jgi:hypothetical protein